MARTRKPSTRYGIIHAKLQEGKAGLMSWEGTCPCPKRGGPDHPREGFPGMVGFGTCRGCRYHLGVYHNSQVCTHPNAYRTAAEWLGQVVEAWKKEKNPESKAQMSLF